MAERIVIIGGGFGGLEAAFSLKSLLGRRAEITLLGTSLRHAFLPSIHLIVSGKTTATEISFPLDTVLGAAGIRFIRGEALSIDTAAGEVITTDARLGYDHLVLAAGASNAFLGIPGAEQFTGRFRTPEDAERIRERLCALLRAAGPCRIVLAGAGTEGVEVIGEVLDLVRSEGRGDDLAAGSISIDLVEGRSSLLPSLPLAAQRRAEEYLRQQGVRLVAGDRIREVREDRVVLESGKELPASLIIWSGGIQPSAIIAGLPFDKDPWGWLKVNDLLQVTADERVFALGDAVSIYTDDGPFSLQRLAYHAQDQARITALNIAAAISGDDPVRYQPRSRPQLISIGSSMGIFSFGDRVSSGAWVVSLKKAIERRHLLAYLSRPLSSAVASRIAGAAFLQRLRSRLPL